MSTIKRKLSYLIFGRKGSQNRIQIIELLKERPYNLNQLAENLDLNYRTVKHHINVLLENELVSTSKTGGYGEVYFLTPEMEENMQLFEDIIKKISDITISPKFFQNVIEQTNVAVIIIDNGGEIFFWNKSAEKLYGYKEKEILGETIPIFPNSTFITELVNKVIKGNKIISLDTRGKHKSGTIIDVSVTIDAIKNNEGKIVGFSILSRDITKRKQVEEAIRQSEERFRQIANNALEWIWEVDANGLYTYASSAIEKILGYKAKEVIGKKHFYDLFNHEDKEELKKAAFEAFAKKQPFREFLNRNVHKNGREIWLSTSGVPVLDRDGNLLGYRGADTDITERKKAEREIIELKEFNENIVRNSPAGIITTDMNGQITCVNPSVLEIFGSPGEEKTKELNVLTLEPLVKQGISKLFKKCLNTGEHVKVESIPYTSFWGKPSIVSLNIVPLLGAEDKRIGSVAIVEDCTERKKAEEALCASEARLNALFQASIDGIGVEKEGINVYVNPSFLRMFGYQDSSELICKPIETTIVPEDRERLREYTDKRMRGEAAPTYYEYRGMRRDGSTFDGEVSVSQYHINGELFIVSFVRDITERKKAEEEIRSSEERLKALFQASIDGIGVEKNGVLVYANPAFAHMLGYDAPSQLIGGLIEHFIAPEDRERMAEYTQKRINGDDIPLRYGYHALKRDGHIFDAEISISQYTIDDELYIVGFIRDITESK